MTKRHKVFVSYQHADQEYRNKFEKMCRSIMDSRSVQLGDIDPTLEDRVIAQHIRENFLPDSTVTVVLIGKKTWSRRHVDWEISASLRATPSNPRSGLIGILLPTYQKPQSKKYYTSGTIPPRLYMNLKCSYAEIYSWSTSPGRIQEWIDLAFKNRKNVLPHNSRPLFQSNSRGNSWC